MSASAWRTPWTVAKPKTPAVAVRWRERRRSRPHPSRRRPDLTRKEQPNPKTPPPNSDNPTQPTQPNTKQPHSKHDSPVGPSAPAPSHAAVLRRPAGQLVTAVSGLCKWSSAVWGWLDSRRPSIDRRQCPITVCNAPIATPVYIYVLNLAH